MTREPPRRGVRSLMAALTRIVRAARRGGASMIGARVPELRPPAPPPLAGDPCVQLAEALARGEPPPLEWSIEWSAPGDDALARAWSVSQDGSAMLFLAAQTGPFEALVPALARCLAQPPPAVSARLVDVLARAAPGDASVPAQIAQERAPPTAEGVYLPQATRLRDVHHAQLLDHLEALVLEGLASPAAPGHAERALIHASALPWGTAFPMRDAAEFRRFADREARARLARFADVLRDALPAPQLVPTLDAALERARRS